MIFWGEGGAIALPLTPKHQGEIKVIRHRRNAMGGQVTVSAPLRVWRAGAEVMRRSK